MPTATSDPSFDGKYQSIAVAESALDARRIEQHDGRRRRIAGGAADEHELLGTGRTLVAEQMLAAECGVLEDRQLHQRHESLVPLGPSGYVEHRAGQGVLGGDPGDDVGVVTVLQPAIGVGNGGVVVGVDDVLTPSRRDGSRHGQRGRPSEVEWNQPRPMLGRLPWLALERRIRAFFFFVFFDIGRQSVRAVS